MRGCQRKIIMLKGTDSQIFDEAYFLLRKDLERGGEDDGEFLREAQRIVEMNTTKKRRPGQKSWIAFAAGLVCGIVIFLFFRLI